MRTSRIHRSLVLGATPLAGRPGHGSFLRLLQVLLFLAFAGYFGFTQAACVAPASGLVAWWPGDGNGRDIVNANDGSVLNGVSFIGGRVGNSFSFDGINDRVQLPDVEALKLNSSLTIECWLFVPSFPSPTNNFGLSLVAFRGDDRDSLDPYYLAIESQGRAWFHLASLTAAADLYAFVPTNRFFHLAATLDNASGAMRLYVDGVLSAQSTTTVRPFRDLDPNSNPGFGIGNHPGYPTSPYNFPFKGRIDELSIYNRALTSNEVAGIFAAGAAGKCRPGPMIYVNGQRVTGPAITVNDSAFIQLLSPYENGTMRYTLNGSSPIAGTLYNGPFTVFSSVVLRAIATDAGQTQSAESQAVDITVNVLPQLTGSVDSVNPATATLTASISDVDPDFDAQIAIYEGNKFLFGRPFHNTTSYTMNFTWADVPLGSHCLRAVVVDRLFSGNERTRESGLFCFTISGQQIGFSDVSNLQTSPSPPNVNQATTVACSLRVQNSGSAASNPLRVRLYQSQTYFSMNNPVNPAPTFSEPFYTFAVTNSGLNPGGVFTVNLPLSAGVVCPATAFSEIDFDDRWQYHVFASLEELVGNKWTFIDRAKIFSSLLDYWFPFNDGVVGTDPQVNPLVNTNLFTFLTALSILGNTNIQEGSIVSFVALASLNDGSTGSVNAAWQSSPLPISADGIITAPLVQNNTTVDLNATFTRRTTRTATKRITIVDVGDPVTITLHPTNKIAGVGSNVTWSVSANGTAPRTYQWRKDGANIAGATNQSMTLTNVQLASSGAYNVAVSNVLGAVASSTGMLTVVTRPLLSGPTRGAGGAFRFGIQGTPGSPCRIESSTNLPQWSFLTNFTLTGTSAMLTNTMTGPRRFFRVRIDTTP